MANVTIEGFRLYQAQESKSRTQGNVRVDSIYGTTSEDTLLTGMESMEKVEYTGIATGNRLSLNSEYSSDPETALAQWVAELETFVNGKQGTGWTLHDSQRGKTFNVVLEQVGWHRNKGEKYQVNWDLSGFWANGMMVTQNTSPGSVNPTSTARIDGIDLQSVEAHRQQKQQKIKPYPIAFANPGENEALADAGARRNIQLRGKLHSNMSAFDEQMQALVGQDTIVQYEEPFPGRTLDVMVKNYESSREAGHTRIGEYMLELVEGYV